MPARVSDQKTISKTEPKSVPAKAVQAKSIAPKSEVAVEEKAARTQAPTAVQPVEPEDAYLTGVSRSLQRRLLGLNVDGARPQAQPVPEAESAGVHSTGSYTATPAAIGKTTSVPAKSPKSTKKK
jgi:hypothetical protein